jgi:hypothetical protein
MGPGLRRDDGFSFNLINEANGCTRKEQQKKRHPKVPFLFQSNPDYSASS